MIVYRARWVVPVSGPPIENGAVGVSAGLIRFVGRASDAPDAPVTDFGDSMLMPGLVNAHTHLELTVMRGYLEETDFPAWIDKLRAARYGVLSDEMLLDSARCGIEEGLLAGITTYADTCSSGVVMQAMIDAGVRGIMYQEVFGPFPERADEAMAGLRAAVARYEGSQTSLVSLGISPHAPYTVSDVLYRQAAAYAREKNLPLAAHIAEHAAETELVCAGKGMFADRLSARGIRTVVRARSPVDLLRSVGALGEKTLLIHCVAIDDADIAEIASAGSAVAHCPISNAKFGHGIAPVHGLLAAGIRVGLGSDSMASNNRMHLLEEARSAVFYSRLRCSAQALGAEEAIELATLGGARALGLDDRIGSLDEGKAADFAVFDLSSPAVVPVGDPAATAIFSLGGTGASFVAVGGCPLVRDGALLQRDKKVAARMESAARALRDFAARPRPT